MVQSKLFSLEGLWLLTGEAGFVVIPDPLGLQVLICASSFVKNKTSSAAK